MRKVTLIFPDVITNTEFLLTQKVSMAITNTAEKELRGIVSDKLLGIACKDYRAKIKESMRIQSSGW